MKQGTYDINKCEVLTRETYIERKIKDLIKALKDFGFFNKWDKQREQEAKERFGKQYDDLLKNDYDIGYLIPAYVKVKQVVFYDNYYCFIDTNNRLYYIHD